MKNIRSIIKESILNMINESGGYIPLEALNGALKELDSIGQEAKIQAQASMGLDPLSYFYPFPGAIGNQYSMGMQFKGTNRTRRQRKRFVRSDGVEMDQTIELPEKDPDTGEIIIGPDGEPETYRVKIYETIPLGGLLTFSDKFVKAKVFIVPLRREIEVYGLMGSINYIFSLPLFRKRGMEIIDKGVFIFTSITAANTPNGADVNEVFGMGSDIEKAMVALGKYAGIVPEAYNHEEVLNLFKRLRGSYEKSQRNQEAQRKSQEEKDTLAALLASLGKK